MPEENQEFNSFKKLGPQDNSPENKVSTIIFCIGWFAMIISILTGLYVADDQYMNFSFSTFLIVAGIGVLFGALLIGLAEIIRLLHSINYQMKRVAKGEK